MNRVQVVFHAFDHRFKIRQFDRVSREHVLQGHENWMIVFGDGLSACPFQLEADVNQGHHTSSVFLLREGG